MTREWFEDNINDFDDLIEFCSDHSCDILDSLYPESDFDEYICEDIRNATRHDYWTDIRGVLNQIYDEHGGDYFFYNGEFDYVWVSEDWDFEEYKSRVLEWADDTGFFEPDVDDEYFEDEPEEEPTQEDEDFETANLSLLFWQE